MAPRYPDFDNDLRKLAYIYLCFWSFTQMEWRDFKVFVLKRLYTTDRYRRIIRRLTADNEDKNDMLNKYFKQPKQGFLGTGYLEVRGLSRRWLQSERGKQYQRTCARFPLTIPVLDPVLDADYIASAQDLDLGRELFRILFGRIGEGWVVGGFDEWTEAWGRVLQIRMLGWFLVEIYTQKSIGVEERDAYGLITEWRADMPPGCYRDSEIVHKIWIDIDEKSQAAIQQLIDDGTIEDDAYVTIEARNGDKVTLPK